MDYTGYTWFEVCNYIVTKDLDDLLASPIWYNNQLTITSHTLYFQKWHRCGIHFIGDLIQGNGKIKHYMEYTISTI